VFGGKYLPLLWLLSLLGGFSFELARKLHAPAAERAGVDSYSQALGYGPALALTVAVLLAGGAVQALLLRTLHARPAAYAGLAGLLAAGLALYAGAAHRPLEARLRQAEKVVSLIMLTSYLAVLAEVYGLGK
jgi:4-hydroxybenzoate polyprenyltransferase